MKRATLLLLLLVVGCGLKIDFSQWSSDHTLVDPNPPGPVVVALRVVIVEETGERPSLPVDQVGIFSSVTLRRYLTENCAKLPDGSNGFRIVDKDDIDQLPAELKVSSPASVPWLYVTNGVKGVGCPLPASADAVIEKVRAFAEGK